MALPALIGIASQFASGAGNPVAGPDGPINTTAGATFQGGLLTVGSKQVGGKGNTAGATSATAAQVPAEQAAALGALPGAMPSWTPWALIGAAVVFFALLLPSRRR